MNVDLYSALRETPSVLRNGTCWRGITQFYLPPTCLNGMSHPAFTP